MLCDHIHEDMQHLFVGCPFSSRVWHEVFSWCCSLTTLPCPAMTFFDRWSSTCSHAPIMYRRGLSSIIMLMSWAIWKHRNGRIFDGQQPSVSRFVYDLKDEAPLWANVGATMMMNIAYMLQDAPSLVILFTLLLLMEKHASFAYS